MKKIVTFSILVLIVAVSTVPAQGQDAFRLVDPNNLGDRYGKGAQDGPPFLHFGSTSQQYYIDHPDYNGMEDEVVASFDRWNQVGTVQFSESPSSGVQVTGAAVDPAAGPAATLTEFNGSTYEIISDSSIITLNTVYEWSDNEQDLFGNPRILDVQTQVTHEAGHIQGLAHPLAGSYTHGADAPTMAGADNAYFENTLEARSLEPSDIAGARFLQFRTPGLYPDLQAALDAAATVNATVSIWDSFTITSAVTVPSNATLTVRSGASLQIDPGVTLTVAGEFNTEDTTTINFDPDAAIVVNSGGAIDATGATFKTTSGGTGSSDRWKHIKLLGGGSSFTDCTFKGADNAIYNYGYNSVYSSEFTGNARGVQVADGTLHLVGTRIHNGTGSEAAWVRGDGWLVTREDGYGSSYEPARIQDGTYGIRVTDYGNVRSNHTLYTDNSSAHVRLSGQAELMAGSESWFSSSEGWNAFYPGPSDDIYNVSSNTAEANYNWWGTPSNPYSSRFYGSVTYDHPLECDPTVDGTECPAIDEGGGGGCSPYCYQANLSSTDNVTLAGNTNATSYEAELSKHEARVKQQVTDLLAAYESSRGSAAGPRNLRKAYRLLQVFDTDGSLRAWAGLEQRLQAWRTRYMDSRDQQHRALGTAAMEVSLSEALYDGQYPQALRMADRFAPYLTSYQQKVSRLSAQAIAWERTGQFGKAVGAYEAIQQLPAPGSLAADTSWAAPDYTGIKAELADSMAARGQSRYRVSPGASAKERQRGEQLPAEAALSEPYPNPFNPQVTIPFAVPERSHVTVEVYNMLGRRVALLADRSYQAGRYRLPLNGENLSSGVYFVRLQVGQQLFSKKVTLIK